MRVVWGLNWSVRCRSRESAGGGWRLKEAFASLMVCLTPAPSRLVGPPDIPNLGRRDGGINCSISWKNSLSRETGPGAGRDPRGEALGDTARGPRGWTSPSCFACSSTPTSEDACLSLHFSVWEAEGTGVLARAVPGVLSAASDPSSGLLCFMRCPVGLCWVGRCGVEQRQVKVGFQGAHGLLRL